MGQGHVSSGDAQTGASFRGDRSAFMYDTFFHLSGKPFQLSPDPEFFYSSAGHSRAYAYLKFGVAQGDGFIVISGEIGAGKTMLVRTLLDEIDPALIVAAQLVTSHLDAQDVLITVAHAFGLPLLNAEGSPLPRVLIQSAFENFLTERASAGQRALLVVDEAQELGMQALAALRLLSNFQVNARPVLQVFLVGQPELATMLASGSLEQLRQRVIASYHLGPLDRRETLAYIQHRLSKVGWTGDPRFEPDAFDAIHEASKGIPRLVNLLCERIFFALALHEQHLVTAADVHQAVEEMKLEIRSPWTDDEGGGVVVHGGQARSRVPLRKSTPVDAKAAGMVQTLERLERAMERVLELLSVSAKEPVPTRRRSFFRRDE